MKTEISNGDAINITNYVGMQPPAYNPAEMEAFRERLAKTDGPSAAYISYLSKAALKAIHDDKVGLVGAHLTEALQEYSKPGVNAALLDATLEQIAKYASMPVKADATEDRKQIIHNFKVNTVKTFEAKKQEFETKSNQPAAIKMASLINICLPQ